MKNIPIGEVLVQSGYMTSEQLEAALKEQKSKPGRRLGQVVVDMGFVTERQTLEALGKRLNIKFLELETYKINQDAVNIIPRQLAQKYELIAIDIVEGKLVVALSDPLNFYAIEDVRQIANMPLELCVALKSDILEAVNGQYAQLEAKRAATKANVSVTKIDVPEDNESDEEETPIVKLLNTLLLSGENMGASDIHIEPFAEKIRVRMRVDGMIVDYMTLEKSLHNSLMVRMKILANLNIAEKRLPQDGHFKADIEGTQINVRVSIVPTIYGEKAVLRFLSQNAPIDHVNHYGMNDETYAKMREIMKNPSGIIYITGPTGSGKTTTLYMVLEEMAKLQVNISSVEDPVERNIDRMNQMQVNNVAGLTFEAGLRALLRQDPDIIMVGETRDSETATISVRAAITGHQVVSTLHTNDAISSIVRLEDMGVPRYLIANSLSGLVAQRLVRKVCPYCGYEYEPSEEEKTLLGDKNIGKLKRGKGCHICNETGYKGRIAIHEIVQIDRNIRRMIIANETIANITKYAKEEQGMKTLRQNMIELVKQGITTVDELVKVMYSAE